MADILGRIKANRADKAPIKFTDHKGEQREDRYLPLFTVWANKFGGGDVSPEKNLSEKQLLEVVRGLLKPKGQREYFLSYFPVKDPGPREEDF